MHDMSIPPPHPPCHPDFPSLPNGASRLPTRIGLTAHWNPKTMTTPTSTTTSRRLETWTMTTMSTCQCLPQSAKKSIETTPLPTDRTIHRQGEVERGKRPESEEGKEDRKGVGKGGEGRVEGGGERGRGGLGATLLPPFACVFILLRRTRFRDRPAARPRNLYVSIYSVFCFRFLSVVPFSLARLRPRVLFFGTAAAAAAAV